MEIGPSADCTCYSHNLLTVCFLCVCFSIVILCVGVCLKELAHSRNGKAASLPYQAVEHSGLAAVLGSL